METILLKYICPYCKNKSNAFPINSTVYVEGQDRNIRDKIYITTLECDKCGQKTTVQIDNDYTYGLLDKQKKINFEMGTARFKFGSSGTRITKIEKQLTHTSMKLLKEREILSKIYNHLEYYDNPDDETIIGTIDYKNVKTQLVKENL